MKGRWRLVWAAPSRLALAALLVIGCSATAKPAPAAAPAAPRPRVAVAPAEWASDDKVEIDVPRVAASALSGARVELIELGPALAAAGEPCLADPKCVEDTAREAHATQLVRARLAALGGTVLVRLGVTDLETGTRAEERQAVVSSADGARVEDAVRGLVRAVAAPYFPPPPAPKGTPWYDEWWVWTLIGTAVIGTGAAIGAGVYAAGPGPDVTITPP